MYSHKLDLILFDFGMHFQILSYILSSFFEPIVVFIIGSTYWLPAWCFPKFIVWLAIPVHLLLAVSFHHHSMAAQQFQEFFAID